MTKDSLIQQAFEVAAERYAAVGVDVRKALEDMKKISLSLHCWQADDVSGFENQGGSLHKLGYDHRIFLDQGIVLDSA